MYKSTPTGWIRVLLTALTWQCFCKLQTRPACLCRIPPRWCAQSGYLHSWSHRHFSYHGSFSSFSCRSVLGYKGPLGYTDNGSCSSHLVQTFTAPTSQATLRCHLVETYHPILDAICLIGFIQQRVALHLRQGPLENNGMLTNTLSFASTGHTN